MPSLKLHNKSNTNKVAGHDDYYTGFLSIKLIGNMTCT